MEELQCTTCGLPLTEGEPQCSACKLQMACADGICTCSCGNTVKLEEVKCTECLAE